VDGVVYLDVSNEDIRRLDQFEGDLYDRQSQRVIMESGEGVVADAYVLKETYSHMTDDDEWDPLWFARDGLPVFLGGYRGFR
jgi:hypothetical protein